MIRYLRGQVLFKDLKSVCVDTGGVGYLVYMTMPELAALGEDVEVQLHIHTHVREGALELFGFVDGQTLKVFEQLISITGVGPKSALGILSGMDQDAFVSAVMAGDEKRLLKAPGIGKKTAARIVLELQDRLKREGISSDASLPAVKGDSNAINDLESALLNLGYRQGQVDKAIQAIEPQIQAGEALPALVREALKHV